MEQEEVLKYAIEHGIIDIEIVKLQAEMDERKKYLEKHPYSIWQGKDKNWYSYLPDEKGRKKIKAAKEESLHDKIVQYWREEAYNPDIKTLFYEWLDEKQAFGEISLSTYQRYEADFLKYFAEIKAHKIKGYNEEKIEFFIKSSISNYNMTQKNFSNFRILIYGIFKRAKKKKLVSFSITSLMNDIEISNKAFKPKIVENDKNIYFSDEKKLIEDYLMENQDLVNLGLLLIFKTGVRIGELVAIKKDDVSADFSHIKIRRTEIRYRDKNKKMVYEVREFPKTEAGIRPAIIPKQYTWIVEKIFNINPTGEYLFERVNKGRPTTHVFRDRLSYICKNKIHITPKSPHKIRKTYGTILLDNNVSEATIISSMGHADILCTKNHYLFDRNSIKDKQETLSKISEL